MTDRIPQDSASQSKQIVNLNFLDREAEIYKSSKNTLIETSNEIQKAVEQNTKKEIEDVNAAIKKLNEKVERIMETDFVKKRQEKIESAQQQMMRSIKEAADTFFKVKQDIRSKENLSMY